MEKCRVVMVDRNMEGMEQIAKTFQEGVHDASTSTYTMVQCDVSDPRQVKDLIQEADKFASTIPNASQQNFEPHVSMLVNCAGITRDNWIYKMTLEEWNDVLDVNLKSTFLTCRYFLDQQRLDTFFPKMNDDMAQHRASIVNVGSIVSERGNLGQTNYAASKGGVLGLTRALAKEVASRNINVNAVAPGFIESPMTDAVPAHVKERMVLQIPMRRFGKPSEVADLICFLLSPRSSYITGETVHVSGMISL
jgi:NAD(P)-dependent dehydrogenase (short-subunit alcohol dehydrogenase family)